ncbi:uncharacterized protein PAN0_005d2675 [Moesziomyces antarcticus]|uniref:Uncharacterized protein n=2 Tax=Pseudozyma antarctica TaxID=84753 RepID=A0A081CCR5_PSEA2|nr:uncharacterized protein PAN0_005d2675 [Moesziomyces antarcticus]GAK64461.1 hypothetical protein PAN0_005d2675 [Moesziomyces antarcticus]SPO45030.1 uncharacterized protein PSANT_02716 [Moesziomyces antarcticus]
MPAAKTWKPLPVANVAKAAAIRKPAASPSSVSLLLEDKRTDETDTNRAPLTLKLPLKTKTVGESHDDSSGEDNTMVEVRRDRGEGRGGDSDQAGPSRKRRRSHGEDDAGEEPEARRRKKKPLPRRRQIREHLLVRHWRDEGCDTCVSQGIECVPPEADSKQEKCDDCAARSNECSGRWITKQENVSKMHNLLTGRNPLQIDDEWVEAEIKTFGNYLGGPWDKQVLPSRPNDLVPKQLVLKKRLLNLAPNVSIPFVNPCPRSINATIGSCAIDGGVRAFPKRARRTSVVPRNVCGQLPGRPDAS